MRHLKFAFVLLAGILIGALGSLLTTTGAASADDAREPPRVVHDTRAVHKIDGENQMRAVLLAQGNNAFLGKLIVQPNAQIAARRNATEEYLYVIEGSSVMTINGQSYIVGPNMAVYLPPDSEVSFINGNEPLVAVQVFAGPEPAAQYRGWRTRDASQPAPARRNRPKYRQRQSLHLAPDSPVLSAER